MVGGGSGAFIGAVHRMAAVLDNEFELVAGAFSSDPARSFASGEELGLPKNRVYGSYTEMFEKEKALPENERIDAVSIVTPNNMHFAPAMAAIGAGIDVICDKPLCMTQAEAVKLRDAVRKSGLVFALTHNYTGYPMVKEAREAVRSGKLGKIRKIVVEYPQGWLSTPLEAQSQKQASWRVDPARAGSSCCMGDIGSHAENLAEYITGLKISELCADLTTFVKGRLLDDDGNVLLRFENGARGVLYASQISVGEENSLHIRVYGEKGGLEWDQMEPNTLKMKWGDRPAELVRTGVGNLSASARWATRLPAGHPEGFLEAFANIYRNFAKAVRKRRWGTPTQPEQLDFPTIDDGVRGMSFIETVVASAKAGSVWKKMPR